MFILIFLYDLLLGPLASQAYPATLPIDITLTPSLVSRLDPGLANDGDSCNKRTMWNIISSCATTLFACIWVSRHPNFPKSKEGSWKILQRRLASMLRMVFVPEVAVCRAFMEFSDAKKVANTYNKLQESGRIKAQVARTGEKAEIRWTRTHGFFINMGGFMLCSADGTPMGTLHYDRLFLYAKNGGIELPNISKEEIYDRSKGDYFSKGIIVLHTTWFIATCIARAVQHLPITELEIVTLAFASLNGFVYFFYWKKPLNVRCPVHVYLKPIEQQPPISPGPITPIKQKASEGYPSEISAHLLDEKFDSDDADDEPTTLRTYFSPSLGKFDPQTMGFSFIMLAILGAAFGGIHLIAWSFHFPTKLEQLIWRISSLTLFINPMILGLFMLMEKLNDKNFGHARILGFIASKLKLATLIVAVTYTCARVMLCIIPFYALRSLPPGALDDVKWVSFIPHIG